MPTIAEALQIGWRHHQSGDVRRAEQIYRQVLGVAPTDANAWCFLGIAQHDQSQFTDAVNSYREAIRHQPNFPVAYSNMGNSLKALGRLDDAVASCQEALRQKPDYSSAYNNLGAALLAQGKLDEAAASFAKAVAATPQDALSRANLGATLVKQGRLEEGAVHSQKALQLNPNYAEAHKNQAIVWLLQGDWERGWPEFEWRWKCPGMALPNFWQPLWDGSPLAGRTILLICEQGLGDTLHFARYAKRLKQQGARVLLQCQKSLMKILETCEGIDELIPQEMSLPHFDCYAPLVSIAGLLRTTPSTVPADVPYLSTDPALVEKWCSVVGSFQTFNIGIAWQGSVAYHADRQRSIPLNHFAPLAAIPGVRLISLQKGFGAEQVKEVAGKFSVTDFTEQLDVQTGAFLDTAALLKSLDLVICADTSIGHLAGALGVPTWLALPFVPDWRWLLGRDDSPWYPTTRLFRQSVADDWPTVFERMAKELTNRIQASPPPPSLTDNFATIAPRQAAEIRPLIEISVGELIDKLTILEIKVARISDPVKLANVRAELASLQTARDEVVPSSEQLSSLTAELREVNERLWEIEDGIRDCERNQDFGPRFIDFARAVYKTNDHRAALKRQINEFLGSRLVEEKSYQSYVQ